ncbi:hypothetical protein LTR62_004291 [Meristemomyces frigidus]|uniref:Pyridoxamine 5'-phosphate oxidase putative domain-containing protein n=1 Tax=Meristemomyces frigidus TaxID=1508187 RepID=A0AAN7TF24_9PEZI|nr:hypothetical protein LTR62_004291 [Meristemomyces frigidus]
MGVFYESIPPSLIQWIPKQNWVATAPLSGSGHVNVSPKGGKYFGVVNERTFYYLDLSGSGNETISHLLEPGNGRITIQLNEFEHAAPKIVRLWGHGRVLERDTTEFNTFVKSQDLYSMLEALPGHRSVIVVDIHQVGSSCGFSVPYMDFKSFRTTLNDFYANKDKKFKAGNEKESMDHYWAYKNAWSMDGLPGLPRATIAAKRESIVPIKKMVGPRATQQYVCRNGMAPSMVLVIAMLAFLLGIMVALHADYLLSLAQNIIPEALKNAVVQGKA